MPEWPTFVDEQTIIGWNLLGFVDWVESSKKCILAESDPGFMLIIVLPPVQRSAVWRPKQVLDIWDSLMRGMPVGSFYLVSRSSCPRNAVVIGTNQTTKVSAKGFDLLDGQQRVRALMAGVHGDADEKRCLWVDLGSETADGSPCLRLTSKAQPFGYDAKTGSKLSLDERRKARAEIEPDPKNHRLEIVDGSTGLRRAYDLELYENEVTQDGARLRHQPPLPYGTTEGKVFPLHKLLAAWRKCAPCDAEQGIAALRQVTGDAPELEGPLAKLHDGFCKLGKAQVALLKVDTDYFLGGDQDLLVLFERIGAAGTPLSRDERLYSIYKHHVPEIRDTVDAIHRNAGRVLLPTQIVVAALRIANALMPENGNNIPDPAEFAKRMVATPESDLRKKLGQLLPSASKVSGGTLGTVDRSFVTVKSLLSHEDGAGSMWLPDVMLAILPAEVWQVLVFWATVCPEPANLEHSRQEAVRFALFWRLCVWNDEKAARAAFECVKTMKGGERDFPGFALYQRLIGASQDERHAHAIIRPDDFETKLCKDESSLWRTDAERFVDNNIRNDIGSNWWWHGRKLLPWLQRDYIKEAFPGYVPLSDHEDDLPYDVDHICPSKDWDNWVSVRGRLDKVEGKVLKRMQDERGGVGNGIGNLRLVDSSINREDQDEDISKKMPFAIVKGEPSDSDKDEMSKSAFPPGLEHRTLWERVSCPGPVKDRRWSINRLAAFQRAVEQRAAWLYRGFYDELGYAAWISEPRQPDHES